MTRFPTLPGYLAGLLILAAVIVAGDALPRPVDIAILTIIILVEPLLSGLGALYVWVLYRRDRARPRSWLLFWLALFMSLIALGLIPIAILAVRRQLGLPPLDADTTGIVVGGGIALIGSVPIHMAVLLWRIRRGRANAAAAAGYADLNALADTGPNVEG